VAALAAVVAAAFERPVPSKVRSYFTFFIPAPHARLCRAVWSHTVYGQHVLQDQNALELAHVGSAYHRENIRLRSAHAPQCQL
jgi:hypothetical protein